MATPEKLQNGTAESSVKYSRMLLDNREDCSRWHLIPILPTFTPFFRQNFGSCFFWKQNWWIFWGTNLHYTIRFLLQPTTHFSTALILIMDLAADGFVWVYLKHIFLLSFLCGHLDFSVCRYTLSKEYCYTILSYSFIMNAQKDERISMYIWYRFYG